MRLEQLEYLVVISKSRSLNVASKRLFISQQALGKAIKDLEDELHVPLLIRTHNGCFLTKEGCEVLEAGKEILHLVNNLKGRYTECAEVVGDLLILSCPSMHETILPSVIGDFSELMPHVKVSAMAKDSFLIPDLQQQLSENNSNKDKKIVSILAIPSVNAILKEKATSPDFEFHVLVDDYWVACMSKTNPLAHRANLSLDLLLKQPLIVEYPDLPEYGLDYSTLAYFADLQDVDFKKVVDSEAMMYSTIEKGNYVGFASHFFAVNCRHVYPSVVFKTFTPPIDAKIGCLVEKAIADDLIVKTFLRCLEDKM